MSKTGKALDPYTPPPIQPEQQGDAATDRSSDASVDVGSGEDVDETSAGGLQYPDDVPTSRGRRP